MLVALRIAAATFGAAIATTTRAAIKEDITVTLEVEVSVTITIALAVVIPVVATIDIKITEHILTDTNEEVTLGEGDCFLVGNNIVSIQCIESC